VRRLSREHRAKHYSDLATAVLDDLDMLRTTTVCVFASAALLCAQNRTRWESVRTTPAVLNQETLDRLISGPSGQLAAVSQKFLLKSADGGMSWSVQRHDAPGRIDAIAFSSPDTLWEAISTPTEGTMFLASSSDGGATWKKTLTLSSPDPMGICDIAFFDEAFGIAVGEFELHPLILTTRDGGQSWYVRLLETDDPDYILRRVAFRSKSEIWLVGANSMYVSRNAGDNWTLAYHGSAAMLNEIAFGQSDIFAVGGFGMILHSPDGGETWNKIGLSEPLASRFLWSIGLLDSGRAWVAGDRGTIASTLDGGQTWQMEETGQDEFIRDIKVFGKKVFAIGDNGTLIRRSVNSGFK